MTSESRPIKLALVSCGLGHVQRGIEISTSRWQAALSDDHRLDVRLYSGGDFPGATRVWNLSRSALFHSPLGAFRMMGEKHFWELCCAFEQLSFSLGFLPELFSWRPDIVWTKELSFARILRGVRGLSGLKFKIIFANGGGLGPTSYKHFDLIQHLYPDSFEQASQFGIRGDKMHILPNCVTYNVPGSSRETVRHHFGFENDDWIVICVAAWNCHEKRLDYLINEVAAMADENVKLLLCGHPEAETPWLKTFAADKLGSKVRWLTLSPEDVHRALYISNVFVLPSLSEGLPNALIEAVMAGLPAMSHPHAGGKYILENSPWLVDMSAEGELKNRLKTLKRGNQTEAAVRQSQNRAFERFSSGKLAEQFYEMVKSLHISGTSLP